MIIAGEWMAPKIFSYNGDHFIEVKDVKLASIITQSIPAQMIAYYLALQKELDPDKPRNLAKSVTVK